jgi:hypothetical protein
MAIHAAKNPYPGINAHVNSFLQAEAGEWESFHSIQITYLVESLNSVLPSGYFAHAERSMQISEIAVPLSKPQKTRADVMIYQTDEGKKSNPLAKKIAPTVAYEATRFLEELTLEDEAPLSAIIIYEGIGVPVTRIELLSPANKVGGSHHRKYIERRIETLSSGMRLVELDYLHELPPIVPKHPAYANGEAGATPYLFVITDLRTSFEDGLIQVYGFGVDEPFPPAPIPLANDEVLVFDLGASYNRTYESSRLFHLAIDYSQPPLHFDRYQPADRERIEQRMKLIAAEQIQK